MSEKSPEVPKDITIVPAGFPEAVFNKAIKELKSTAPRALAFESEKQRNAQFIQKGLTKPGRISYDVLRRAAHSVHIARICVTVLKEKVTKTQWVIKTIDPLKTGCEEQIKEVEKLFRKPNKNSETFRTLLDKMLEDLLVLDTVSLEKTRYPDGKLAELFFVDSATIRPVFDEHGNQDIEIPLHTDEGDVTLPVSYLQIEDSSPYGGPESGEIIAAWAKKDFVYFHMHPQGSMEGFGYGLSPIESVLSVVANILNADNYNGTYFEEGSFPPVIIQMMGQVGQRDLEAYREYLYSELQGNFHRPAIMAGGEKAEVLNLKDLTNRDMEFMDYMQFLARLLAAAYGLSGQDIGLVDDLNKATSTVQKGLSEDKGYSSILHLLKETFNQDIIWGDFGYEDIEFDWVADDKTDPKDAVDIHDKSLRNGTMTINEVREAIGEQPFGDWADVPMLLTADGYEPLKVEDQQPDDGEEKAEGDKEDYSESKDKEFEKSIYTPDGYRTWFDDRGYAQPFICTDILSGTGYVIKPPVAVNMLSQRLEENLSNELRKKGLNVPSVTRMLATDVVNNILSSDSVRVEFKNYINMTPEYDSEKWKNKFGGSRKYPYYIVSEYIDGFPLNNPLILADMKRDPFSYRQAIEDLAKLWKAEKDMVLGDRRADQYIITPDKRAFGFDYQFKGDKKRWSDSSGSIQNALVGIPELATIFANKIQEKSVLKSMIQFVADKVVNPKADLAVDRPDSIDIPILFGELITDKPRMEKIKAQFKKDPVSFVINTYMKELNFGYELNNETNRMGEFIQKHPSFFGVVVPSEDERGVRYTAYAKEL